MDDKDIEQELPYRLIELSLSLLEALMCLIIILEPELEYWIEFAEPFLDEIQQHQKQMVLECHRQKHDDEEEEREDD